MNRNTNLMMGAIPQIHAQRSKIDRSKSRHMTFGFGDIVPIYVDSDIMPGDTVEMDLNSLVRLATPIAPVTDNLICDVYAFFTPHRIVWEHWEEFWGQNDDPWIQTTEYLVPQLTSPTGGWKDGSIADYFTIPTFVDNIHANALPFRAYSKTVSDWFRDENLKAASHFYTDDTDRTGSNGTNYVLDPELGGMPAKAAKTADMFTKALPSPQKGPSVAVPIGTMAPVGAGSKLWDTTTYEKTFTYGMQWAKINSSHQWTGGTFGSNQLLGVQPTGTPAKNAITITSTGTVAPQDAIAPVNLWADLSNATASTINELRTAFAIQKYYEAAARYGTRYIEYIRAVFGVESTDARMQRSEYLGGTRIPINMSAIVQTSATDTVTPQGNASGYSCTISKDSLFTKSFEEHGTLMLLAVVRVDKRSYQNGLHKMFSRRKWSDFYNPFFANLGEMPILNREIYAQGDSVVDSNGNIIDEQVFGYQEAWAEYRYAQDEICGDMRSNAPNGSLDFFHYGDDYNALPTLGATWIDEPHANIDRTIAVASETAHPIIGDFYFDVQYTRVMPVYSMPGLIDHV